MYQDRLLKFFGCIAGQAESQSRVECVEMMLGCLVMWSKAKNVNTRWRCCQLVGSLMNTLPEEADISDETAESVERAMLGLLHDSKPTVRTAAVKALARFPQPSEVRWE